ncbi:sensor histidine kinase [Pleurocapsa sp. PCC 7319]|uniref:sensor histidine kinase n=1 Tax=Pleurocapsa sp. PCC 7319 TaxID=118161 RepID=UPI00034CF7A3|nr:sensor histidine kinase [Pleurocapsa sp. PCC 7319]
MWQKHSFRLLLYLEWVLLGIALLAAFSLVIPHHRHHLVYHPAHPALFNLAGILCIATLGLMGLRLPSNSKLLQQIYIGGGFIFSWLTILLIGRGERVFPALLLIVLIRACLLFSWSGRIFVAILAYISFLAVQIMSLMRINPFGIPLGRRFPPILRRLPSEELRRILFGLAFNSALFFAFVLVFVLLLVGAVLAEHESRAKLVKAHRRLGQYALQIEAQATLQERNRIAREIHDSVGHYLTAQSIQLENTALFLAQDPAKASGHLAKARQLGKEALANIRSSVAALRNNSLEERSLKVMLEELIAEFESNTNIAIAFKMSHRLPRRETTGPAVTVGQVSALAPEVSTALYRIVQEALTNITRHSQATQVNLNLEAAAEKVSLSIKDNGCGFNPQDNTTGFGLQGIQERTTALQGSLRIMSEYGKGCQIQVEIPKK